MKLLGHAFGVAVEALNAAGSLLILAAMLLMCADVFMRDLANRPINGVAEMVAASIIVIVFLQLPSTVRHRRMVQADLFIDGFARRHPGPGNLLLAVYHWLGVTMMAVVFYATLPIFRRAWVNDEFFGVQGMFMAPSWPIQFVVLLGTVFAGLQYLILTLGHLMAALRREKEEA